MKGMLEMGFEEIEADLTWFEEAKVSNFRIITKASFQ
jgi:hypothetical protein